LDLTKEDKKSLRVLFTSRPFVKAEAEKIIPTCENDEEVLDYLKELLKPVQQSSPSQDVDVFADSIINEQSISFELSPYSSYIVQQPSPQDATDSIINEQSISPSSSDNTQQPSHIAQQSSQDVNVAVDPVVNELSISSKKIQGDTHLPENASLFLRYYELWNKPYDDWPSLREFSEYLQGVKKDRVHNSFIMEIRALQKLFRSDHPAQLRLEHLEGQLKNCQKPRKSGEKKLTKAETKLKITEKKLKIAKNSVVTNGYYRINDHLNQYHEATSKLLKRDLSLDDERTDTKKHENAKLRQALEGHETRITKLEQGEKEKSISAKNVSHSPVNSNDTPEQIVSLSKDVSPSDNVSVKQSNSDVYIETKFSEDKERDDFLDRIEKEKKHRDQDLSLVNQDAPSVEPAMPISSNSSCDTKTVSSGNDQKKVLSKSSELIPIGPDDGYISDSSDHFGELDKNKVVEQGLIQELRRCGDSKVFADKKDVEINESCATQISKTQIPKFAPNLARFIDKEGESDAYWVLSSHCPLCRENHMRIPFDKVLEAYPENSKLTQELKAQSFTLPIPWNNALKFLNKSITLCSTEYRKSEIENITSVTH
ncbi:13864_t:CDS:2, partial [Gigaspora margarita]